MGLWSPPSLSGNTFGFAVWRGTTVAMTAPHAHNDIEINFCAAPVTYDAAGRTSILPAGVPSAFWGATPHQLVDIPPDVPLAYATIPLARFLSWRVPADAKDRLLGGEILRGRDAFDGLGSRFERWSEDLRAASENARRATALEIEALVIRMSDGDFSEARAGSSRSSQDLRRAADMATFVAANFAGDIRVPDVARAVHLHPHRAAAAFRGVFGISITSYVQRYRVAEAQRLLLTTDLPSGAVGTRVGFQSTSSYHAAFAAVTGISPASWRRAQVTGS
ncbi:helix-turn-helix domain-containing protein [Microbacterium sp. P01]|uniref:helix-turn-helix domain-containing protein n=1 Tax=unclassified Microbacterium TaxID=2609290 RepID=UPI003671AD33